MSEAAQTGAADGTVFTLDRRMDAVMAFVSSPNAQARVFGRLLATEVPDAIEAWLQAEEARGTPRELVLGAVMNQAANVAAAILLSGRQSPGEKALKEVGALTGAMFDQMLGTSLAVVAAYGDQPSTTGANP